MTASHPLDDPSGKRLSLKAAERNARLATSRPCRRARPQLHRLPKHAMLPMRPRDKPPARSRPHARQRPAGSRPVAPRHRSAAHQPGAPCRAALGSAWPPGSPRWKRRHSGRAPPAATPPGRRPMSRCRPARPSRSASMRSALSRPCQRRSSWPQAGGGVYWPCERPKPKLLARRCGLLRPEPPASRLGRRACSWRAGAGAAQAAAVAGA
jgi:hypothetical protein